MISKAAIAINNGIPEYELDEGDVNNEGKFPRPEFGEFKNSAINMLFAIWTPIAVSKPFSPSTIIPSISPNIKADTTIVMLISRVVPL